MTRRAHAHPDGDKRQALDFARMMARVELVAIDDDDEELRRRPLAPAGLGLEHPSTPAACRHHDSSSTGSADPAFLRFFRTALPRADSTTARVTVQPSTTAQSCWIKATAHQDQKSELYGRTLVVFAAQHYASQLVLANSQRRGSVLPRSHKDTARKAFERITKNVLPGTHAQLQRALNAEARDYTSKTGELETREREDRAAAAAHNADSDVDELQDGDELDELLEDLDLEDDSD